MKDHTIDRPRVLVLTSTFPRWKDDPEPAFVFELSRRLCRFFDVTVLSPRTPGGKSVESMDGLRVVRFPYFINRWEKLAMHGGGILNNLKVNPWYHLMVPFFLLGQLWAIVRLLRKEQFDLIHAHWLIPQGIVAVLGLMISRRRIPLLCTSHGGDLFALRGKILYHMKRWIIDRSRALTVVSRAMQNTVADMGVSLDKVHVISMGVDLAHLFIPDSKTERNACELLFVGRLVEVKGLRVLLDAMPKVIAAYPEASLIVAGAGPLEDELRAQARQLNISHKIKFLGMVKQAELPGLYQRAALAVFPFVFTKSGVQEGFGLVVVEAMGCGCPVIASDMPAIHDSLAHEESGWLVPSDNTQALADAIIGALNDPEFCNRLADEARARVARRFDWDVIAEKYGQLYNKLIRAQRIDMGG